MNTRMLRRGLPAYCTSSDRSSRRQLPIAVAVGALFLLSACGGASSATPLAEEATPQAMNVQDETTVPQAQNEGDTAPDTTAPAENVDDIAEVVLSDAPSPVGGTVKQITIAGPEIGVLVACDQDGFEPFFFTDQGNWVGCSLMEGAEPGTASLLTDPAMNDVTSPQGGMVKQVTIPGPEIGVLVACGQDDFEPFFFTDQGDWVGCQLSP